MNKINRKIKPIVFTISGNLENNKYPYISILNTQLNKAEIVILHQHNKTSNLDMVLFNKKDIKRLKIILKKISNN